MSIWWTALGLALVLESLLPLLNPGGWRRVFEQVLRLSDGQIRFIGLVGVLVGASLAWAFA